MINNQTRGNIVLILIALGAIVGSALIGSFYWNSQKKPAPPPVAPQPTPPPPKDNSIFRILPEDDMSNWKTYTDENIGFSIKYPPNLKPSPNISGVFFMLNPEISGVSLLILKNPDGLTPKDWLKSGKKIPGQFDAAKTDLNKTVTKNIFGLYWLVAQEGEPLLVILPEQYRWLMMNKDDVYLVGRESSSTDHAVELMLSTIRFFVPQNEGKFCGGIAGIKCSDGYECKLQGSYPDAGGTCTKGNSGKQVLCQSKKGTWSADYDECNGLKETECTQIGGTFYSCASPCRHDLKATVCIQSCAEVCQL